jgi:hypothetical protein
MRPLVLQPKDARWGDVQLPVGTVRQGEHDHLLVQLTIAEDGVTPARQQSPLPRAGGRFALDAVPFAPAAAVELGTDSIQLPGLAPRVLWVDDDLEQGDPVALACDGAWPDGHRVVMRWRGRLASPRMARDWLLLSLEVDAAPRELSARLSDRGRMRISVLTDGDEADDAERAALSMARATLAEHAQPTLSVEAFARISAELTEGSEPSPVTLERHGLDADDWLIEERAWLTRLGDEALAGDVASAVAFGDAFVAAQDARGEPAQLDEQLDSYVAMRAHLDLSDDPSTTLRQHGVALSQWMRLDRHWSRKMNLDQELSTHIEARVDSERRRLQNDAPGDDA